VPVDLGGRAAYHLGRLVTEAGHRPPGSPANRRATDLAAAVLEAAGLPVTRRPFATRWWVPGAAALRIDGSRLPIDPPPFCAAASADGVARVVATEPALASLTGAGEVIVLAGDLARPLFPKAFPFEQLPEDAARIAALEDRRPAAVVAVVPDDVAWQPVFEDPDLAFPYATVPASIGRHLETGRRVALEVTSGVVDGEGVNLSAGPVTGPRAVVCAHIDAKVTTPGALDNGAGVAALLTLAETGLEDLGPVELVLFNGEDHYDAPGEQAWLAAGGLEGVELVVNLDGIGLRGHPTAISHLGGDPSLEDAVSAAIASTPSAVAGDPWFESDHAVFAMHGIPAVALTSGAPIALLKARSHAPDEDPATVDPALIADAVRLVREILRARFGR
jgi:hypothetical protein